MKNWGVVMGLFAVATSVLVFGAATANAQTTYSPESFRAAVDSCVSASAIDEFDTIEAALARVQTPCPMRGVVRMPLPRERGTGHIVMYEPERQAFTWTVVLDPQSTTMAGGGASPYNRRYNPMQWDQLPRPVSDQLRRVGNTWFWLLPVQTAGLETSTYEASNALGARATVARTRGTQYTLAVPTSWRSGSGAQVVGMVPMAPGQARSLVDHLALDVVFHAIRPCDICFQGGRVERGTMGGPTFRSPVDIQIEHRYIYAEIDEIRLVDTRDGQAVATFAPRLVDGHQ